jgi:HPt (histidine-containing phosphotransfer) domain-containing protein
LLGGPIDWAHLQQATFGDLALTDEVLDLFASQARYIVTEIGGAPASAAALAHKLKGSARGIGAWSVAEAAAQLETVLVSGNDPRLTLELLVRRVDEAYDAILRRGRNP